MGERYATWVDGEWHEMFMERNHLACCDCGLIHDLKFRITDSGKKRTLHMQVKRNKRATAAMRRPFPEQFKKLLQKRMHDE